MTRSSLFVLLTCVLAIAMPTVLEAQPARDKSTAPAAPVPAPSGTPGAAPGAAPSGVPAAPGEPKDKKLKVVVEMAKKPEPTAPGAVLDGLEKCEPLMVAPIHRLLGSLPPGPVEKPVAIPGAMKHSDIFASTAALLASDPRGAEFLIAAVPDPSYSGMFYAADRVIEAVGRGVEAYDPNAPAGDRTPIWHRDRFWSPWVEEFVEDAEAKKLLRECRWRVPGIMTFRNARTFATSSAQSPLLVVFLVGESPITGINKLALRESLDFIAASKKTLDEVRIVGPQYSGSAPSLRLELKEWLDARHATPAVAPRARPAPLPPPDPCFTLLSGTATNDSVKQKLDTCKAQGDRATAASCKEACRAVKDDSRREPRIAFHATTLPDSVRLNTLYDALGKRFGVEPVPDESGERGKCRLRRVALLKETSTAYSVTPLQALDGGAPLTAGAPQKVPTSETDGDAGAAPSDEATALSTSTTQCEPELVLTFPPHISKVRRAYDAEKKHEAAAAQPGGDVGPSPNLPLVLDEPNEPRDLLPSLSPLTVTSNDLVLGNIIDTLLKRDIRYVGLFATDRGDILFLAQQLLQHAADMRIFVVASELLYAHPKYAAALEGMIGVSTYPLFVDQPKSANPLAALFSGDPEQGVFNATVAILEKPDQLREYSRAKDHARPAAWISVVGKRGAFPLQVEASYVEKTDFVLSAPQPSEWLPAPSDVRPGHLWRLTVFVVSLFVVCLSLANVATFPSLRDWIWPRKAGAKGAKLLYVPEIIPASSPLGSLFYPCHHSEIGVRKDACVVVLFSVVVSAYSCLLALYHRAADSGEWTAYVGTWATFIVAEACLFWSILQLGVTVVRYRKDGGRGLVWFALSCAAFIAAFGTQRFARHAIDASQRFCQEGNCFAIVSRGVALESGVSPVTPLLFAGAIGMLWAICTIDRLRMTDALCGDDDEKPPISRALGIGPPSALPAQQTGEAAPQDIRTLEMELVRTLKGPFSLSQLRARLVFLPVLAIPFYAFGCVKPISTLEAHTRPGAGGWHSLVSADNAVTLLVLVCFLFVVDCAVCLVLVHVRLRALLRRLAHHPLVDAYKRLPSSLSRSLQQQLSGSVPDLNDAACSVLLFRIVTQGQAQGEGPQSLVKSGAVDPFREFDDERALLAKTPGQVLLGRSKAISALLDASGRAVDKNLRTLWKERTSHLPPSGEEVPAEAAPASDADGKKLRMTQLEDFVASLIAIFIPQYVRPLRPLMTMTMGGSVLLLMLLTSYAFQPRHLILSFLWLLILGSGAVVGWVFVQLERDEVLSRIAKSTPGSVEMNSSFVFRLVTWGALPIMSLLAVQYPTIGSALFSWVEPMLKALR